MKFQLPFHSALLGWRKRGFSEKGVEMQDEKRDEKTGEMTFDFTVRLVTIQVAVTP